MFGGDAFVNILTGKTAPAGRLPVTQYPADYINQVEVTDMALRPNKTSGNPGRTYKWYDGAVAPFGYGLHYTNFSIKAAALSQTSFDIANLTSKCNAQYMDLCPFGSFKVNVTNTGKTASDFVTLGFISGNFGEKPYPLKELVAYQRLFNVTAGSTKTATLNVTVGSLSRRATNGDLVLYPGDYSMLLDVPTAAVLNFTLTGSPVTLESWPQPSS
jgi:xylan 1,4-beta-xylosidase